MADSDRVLEIYKLHAELADRVSQRREGANRLYASVLSGLLVFLAAALRFGAGNLSVGALLTFSGLVGVLLVVAWFIVIRSYRQLNTGKFKALHELEKKLPYPFFAREWEILNEGRDFRRYWRLTTVENFLLVVFGLLFLFVLVVGVTN